MAVDYERLTQLLAAARAEFDALTPEQQAHRQHQQRISWAVGESMLREWESGEMPRKMAREYHEKLVRKAAGPCPCGCEQ